MKTKLTLCAFILAAACVFTGPAPINAQSPSPFSGKKPNILVIWGDDIGIANVSAYSDGLMGYETPNIDRIGKRAFASSNITASSHAPRGAPRFSLGSTSSARD